jgi:hypothetical protein
MKATLNTFKTSANEQIKSFGFKHQLVYTSGKNWLYSSIKWKAGRAQGWPQCDGSEKDSCS